jgi:protein-tyrosine phosphatase/membrane-associated phospholipid phosphatase
MSAGSRTPRPWKQAALWLACLAPFFYLSYGVANHLAAQRGDVPSIVFAWEREIPFLAWTIFPYWSINLFYGLSLFLCRTREELHAHGKRLLTAQIVAVTCFVLFPLGFSFGQPEADGAAGWLFAALRGFDKPFNQAPSLHIALLLILWDLYRRALPRAWHWLLHVWSLAIGLSVLTTYQHHFIDLPTGALLGLFCLWLWPLDAASPWRAAGWSRDPRRWRLAGYYALGSIACFAIAFAGYAYWRGTALWLCWPGVALGWVAMNYAFFGAGGFQKNVRGGVSIASRWLFAPYRVGAWLNSRWWTRGQAPAAPVQGALWLGRMPTAAQARALGVTHLVDVCAELPAPHSIPTLCVPVLDLIPADATMLSDVATAIQTQLDAAQAGGDGKVLVCCALGYSRSAAAVAAWMLRHGHASDVDIAIARLREARPCVVLHDAHRLALTALSAAS